MFKAVFLSVFVITLISNLYAKTWDLKASYVGSTSTEAILEFDSFIKIKYKIFRKPSEGSILNAIESQVRHLVGPMAYASVHAVPRGNHVISRVSIDEIGDRTIKATYHYKGVIVVGHGPRDSYNVIVPINPSTIYERSMIGEKNPCTDPKVQELEGSYWYYWSPYRPGCKLVKDRDYLEIKADLTRIENTKESFPEYHNLPDENGNITIHAFFGMDVVAPERNPFKSRDFNSSNYRNFHSYLLKNGYTSKVWSDKEIRSIALTQNSATLPYVETLQKGRVIYRLFFGPTGILEESRSFHWFYRDAIKNASILLYSGHSGLGKHLVLSSIEADIGVPINFNKERYQIFFFDSCTSYRHYSDMYFNRKKTPRDPKGTKNLDILSTGRATYFDAMTNSNVIMGSTIHKALAAAFTGENYISYQTLAERIDSGNLFGINGDEDNETPRPID